ncbi:MAG TPA: aspartyl protease family protein [Streptosporangiaceae bacterium]|nr:aspartyl protease family protein [Streptosporangiaceae bacterium]
MNRNIIGRRQFLRRGGMAAAAAGAALPLLGSQLQGSPARAAPAANADPDQLFAAGWFEAADRGYARQLRHDPGDAHALAQRGYIALLSNRLGAAEKFLTRALQLAPGDTFSRGKLADCYLRQNQLARAVPLLRQTGDPSDAVSAEWYAALAGVPWQVHGAESTRVSIVSINPLPVIEASLNGGAPQPFVFDTGATTPGFTTELADELGLHAVASKTGEDGDGVPTTLYYGWLESFQIGEIEVRNLPVSWSDLTRPSPPNIPVVGAFGTVFFTHFLTTLDYQGLSFVLRRKSEAGLREFQMAAKREGYRPLPLWLADTREDWTHFPCTLGSLNNFGPRLVSTDTGGQGRGIETTPQIAQEAGITVDYNDPIEANGQLYPSISPDKISLGDAVGRHILGAVKPQQPGSGPHGFQFQTIGNFTHEFFKPFAVTLDFLGMNLYVTPTVPDGR